MTSLLVLKTGFFCVPPWFNFSLRITKHGGLGASLCDGRWKTMTNSTLKFTGMCASAARTKRRVDEVPPRGARVPNVTTSGAVYRAAFSDKRMRVYTR